MFTGSERGPLTSDYKYLLRYTTLLQSLPSVVACSINYTSHYTLNLEGVRLVRHSIVHAQYAQLVRVSIAVLRTCISP